MRFLALGTAIVATAGLLAAPAGAAPNKALGEYSQVCKDEHLRCLNQCQESYKNDADVRTCFGVCDDWLDDCDQVFPKALKLQPGTVRPPTAGVLEQPGFTEEGGVSGGQSGTRLQQIQPELQPRFQQVEPQ
jgi:hypothetical protein